MMEGFDLLCLSSRCWCSHNLAWGQLPWGSWPVRNNLFMESRFVLSEATRGCSFMPTGLGGRANGGGGGGICYV